MRTHVQLFLSLFLFGFFAASLYFGGSVGGCGAATDGDGGDGTGTLAVTSPDFNYGGTLPTDSACAAIQGGNDEIPTLNWSNVPDGTQSFALTIIDTSTDPDTTHMVLFNIPAATTQIDDTDPFAQTNFANNYLTQRGYAGPCPPDGDPAHNYEFTLYALSDADLSDNVADTSDANAVIQAIPANDLAHDTITGTFAAP